MKKSVLLMTSILVLFLSACAEKVDVPFIDAVDETFTLRHNSIERTYYVYVPENVEKGAPMLVMLHGYASPLEFFVDRTEMKTFADRDKVILVYPKGTKAYGLNHWNAMLEYSDVDDVGFITSLTRSLIDQYDVNEDLVFVGGHSNGGFMTYMLACQNDELFKAYMVVSGTMSGELWNTCEVSEPRNIFHFHGTGDNIVPIDGSMNESFGWGGAPSIEEMLSLWTDLLENKSEAEDELDGSLKKVTYLGEEGHKVVYIEAYGYGHLWAQDEELFTDEDDVSDVSKLLWAYMMSFVE